ncbi:hypothetical protein FRC09_000580 [Ceratobasidium sp. 395]|nr:hypothetical protein FRC09_000580 [Ceratobasidium sp. 395]
MLRFGLPLHRILQTRPQSSSLFRIVLAARSIHTTKVMQNQLLLAPRDVASSSDKVLVDATWFMPNVARSGLKEWKLRRLPGARFLDLDLVAAPNELGLKHMMPSGKDFAKACEELGIEPGSHVVFYDTHGIFSSPRALYMFKSFGHEKASVLDGGMPRWEDEGFPIETGEPAQFRPTKYAVPKLNESAVRSYEQMTANTKLDPKSSNAELVLDARPYRRFTGEDPEPRPELSSGHMPHSRSLPFNTLLQKNEKGYTTFLPEDKLKQAFESAVGEEAKGRPIVASCGSGMTAGTIWLAGQLLNKPVLAIYDEVRYYDSNDTTSNNDKNPQSWTGYAKRPESVIVKGDETK